MKGQILFQKPVFLKDKAHPEESPFSSLQREFSFTSGLNETTYKNCCVSENVTKAGILSQPEQSPTSFCKRFYTYLVESGGGNSHLAPLHLSPGKTLMYRGSIQQQPGIQSGALWQPAYG